MLRSFLNKKNLAKLHKILNRGSSPKCMPGDHIGFLMYRVSNNQSQLWQSASAEKL